MLWVLVNIIKFINEFSSIFFYIWKIRWIFVHLKNKIEENKHFIHIYMGDFAFKLCSYVRVY